MSFELRYVAPQQIHEWWETCTYDLNCCRIRDTDEVWIEDIYHCIRAGQATLHVGLLNGEYVGCCVLTQREEPFAANKILHVWFCSNRGGHDVLKLGQAHIEQMARQMGAARITFRAPRLAFERLTKDLGYRLADIEFFKEV